MTLDIEQYSEEYDYERLRRINIDIGNLMDAQKYAAYNQMNINDLQKRINDLTNERSRIEKEMYNDNKRNSSRER